MKKFKSTYHMALYILVGITAWAAVAMAIVLKRQDFLYGLLAWVVLSKLQDFCEEDIK